MSAPALIPFDPTQTHIAYLHAWPLIGKLGTGDPFPIKKLDFESERSLLFHTLNQAQKAIRLQMEVATSDNLLRLITMGVRAIHYTGHGMPTCLAFEDDEGRMHPMDPAQLKELVEAGRGPPAAAGSGGDTDTAAQRQRTGGIEFVFVSACHSESAGLAFVAAGVPHVIAVKTDAAVCDKASQIFMNHFYLALLVGKTVRASFDIAQKAVRHNPRLSTAAAGDEPRKFLLLPEGADHDRTLFTDIPPGRWTDASIVPAPHTIPAIPENFLGRNFLLQKVIAHLSRKRLVTLTGARGIGKTSVAVAAARYIWIRNRFDGVFMVDVRRLLWAEQHQQQHQQQQQQGHGHGHGHGTQSNGSGESNGNGGDNGGANSGGNGQGGNGNGGHGNGNSGKSQLPNLSSLCSSACQLDETYYSPAKLFRALQKLNRILLILDGADVLLPTAGAGAGAGAGAANAHSPHDGEHGEGGAEGSSSPSSLSSPSHTHSHSHSHPLPLSQRHDLRGFISDFLRQVPGSRMLVTSTQALTGISEVSEAAIPVRPLAPTDAAQLFYDLRPRDIELQEFGCEDPKRAASKLSEHPALKLLAGHPRRIFNAAPLLRDSRMPALAPLIERQIQAEQHALRMEAQAASAQPHAHGTAGAQQQHPPTPSSRTNTPEPSAHLHAQQQQQQAAAAAAAAAAAHALPAHPMAASNQQQQAADLFDHNSFLWFGGHGSSRSAALLAAGAPALSPDDERAWTAASVAGANFWRSSFGRVEAVPWGESVERLFNHFFTSAIGSSERPLSAGDLATLAAKLEAMGSPPGYVHVQVLASFWRDWLALCETVRKVLPLWLQSHPTRVIHGWCNRATCTSLLVESVTPAGVAVHKPVGTFVLRLSESMVGSIAVGFVDQTNKILHTLIVIKADSFLLQLTDGGRSYSSLTELLLQCRPFMFLNPGIAKHAVLGSTPPAGAAGLAGPVPALGAATVPVPASPAAGAHHPPQQGEDSPSHGQAHAHHAAHHSSPHVHTHGLSAQFQSFPNNASGGGVGLFSPPAPGSHGGLHHGHGLFGSGSSSGHAAPSPSLGGVGVGVGAAGLSMPHLVQSQSHGAGSASGLGEAHHSHAHSSPAHRLPHPQSFPSLSGLAAALHVAAPPAPLPLALALGSNPNAEGQPPVPAAGARGPSPSLGQPEGVPGL